MILIKPSLHEEQVNILLLIGRQLGARRKALRLLIALDR
jgi:hypothetical protein